MRHVCSRAHGCSISINRRIRHLRGEILLNMSDSVTYKGYEIYADGFGKDGGDRWQPTLAIARPKESADAPDKEKQFWVKYPKQFYPTREAAAAVALMAGKAIVDGKFPGQTLGDL